MDIREKIRKTGAKFIRLEKQGAAIMTFNKLPQQLPKKLTDIFNYLEAYPDETFTIVGRMEMRAGNVIEEPISHNSLKGISESAMESLAQEVSNIHTSEAIEVEKLKLRLEAKERELIDANAYIEELESKIEELENEPGQLADPQPPAYVNTLINLGAGLLDKYMKQRDELIQLEREKLQKTAHNEPDNE
jgi:hypothetical protein